ncbi:Uncharacterised protein [Mycobacteroides abscessus subsp. bolletii]|uniref:hypothetical protein n=1 Tax=Mycobacteroides abscessus TaxID=36809 RepID=UPI0009A5D200|nr:hypothetical protein [Mycobacteroides abscessus]SKX80559.1 Uncharacterised protein [Mycobacteroides abscessus subsp. bolletii]
MSIEIDGITATAGTYTVHIGRGVSDPLPYKAPAQQHAGAILQAHVRNEQIETIERMERLADDIAWAADFHSSAGLTIPDARKVREYITKIREVNDARP